MSNEKTVVPVKHYKPGCKFPTCPTPGYCMGRPNCAQPAPKNKPGIKPQ